MENVVKRFIAFSIIITLTLTMSFSFGIGNAQAATAPTKLTLKSQVSSNSVDVGAKLKVSVKSVSPKKASKSVKWTISKGSAYGKLTSKKSTSVYIQGTKVGSVYVKAISKSNSSVTKTIKIKVKNLQAKKVSISPGALNVGKDKTSTLKATVTAPQKYGYKKQTTKWTSSNTSIATVTASGVVKGIAEGDATITATNDGKKATCKVTVPSVNVLRAYVLVGNYAANKINYVPVSKNAKVLVWNKATDGYDEGVNNEATIKGSFVQLEDDNADGTADIIRVVKSEDSTTMWEEDMAWKDGIGDEAEPAISDADAIASYDNEYRIPFGERQLTGFGITDYCGTNDFSDIENSTYWPSYDYYNLKSGNGLTMLEGYKTQSQSTGWACAMTSANTVLEWYGERDDLNEEDLAALRGTERKSFTGGTSLTELENVFDNLEKLGMGDWTYEDSYTDGSKYNLYDPDWIQGELAEGHPIIVIWNSFGAHAQVIIGYDNMETENTADDQLILMDPYDTTDHNNDGYTIQSYERLAYGNLTWDGSTKGTQFMVAYPESGWTYNPSTGGGLPAVSSNTFKSDDANKLNDKLYALTEKQLDSGYDGVDRGDNGLGGAAGWESKFEIDQSPYYDFADFYNYENGTTTAPTSTLNMIENFKTIQQATEWTCGCTSSLMVMEHFGKNGKVTDPFETEISLCKNRQDGKRGGTYLSGMNEMFNYMNKEHGQSWVTLDRNDMTDPDDEWSTIEGTSGTEYALQGGSSDDGLIPYMVSNGIPVMIGWDDWGGHWQVIVGYDDMGTSNTQDDVIILADPYDTTDHECDGYVVESFERLVYGWNSSFEEKGQGTTENDFIIAFPSNYNDNTEAVAAEFGL